MDVRVPWLMKKLQKFELKVKVFFKSLYESKLFKLRVQIHNHLRENIAKFRLIAFLDGLYTKISRYCLLEIIKSSEFEKDPEQTRYCEPWFQL